MSFCLGLTGSIGMGKSTTARLFAEEGCAVWDADAAVHRLYRAGGGAVAPLKTAFPEAIRDGAVDRDRLKEIIRHDPDALKRIEEIVHPLVAADRRRFRETAPHDILVFDIPLLFETGGETQMDAVACVTVPEDIQESRVLERGTMTRDQFRQIRDKQMPNAEKLDRSDYVIVTDTIEHARDQVRKIVAEIRTRIANA